MPSGLQKVINDLFSNLGSSHNIEKDLFEMLEQAVSNEELAHAQTSATFLYLYRRLKEHVEALEPYAIR